MSEGKGTCYMRLASDVPDPMAGGALVVRTTADARVRGGQGSVTATLEQYDGQPSYFLELDGDGVGDDGEVASLAAVEALGRALIAAARKARAANTSNRRSRPRPPRLLS